MPALRLTLTLALLALLLPVLAFAARVALDRAAGSVGGCAALRADFEAMDQAHSVPAGALLVIGNTRAGDWQHPPLQLGAVPLLVRASNEASIDALNSCFTRAIAFYRPESLLLFLDDVVAADSEGKPVDALAQLLQHAADYGIDGLLRVVLPLHTPATGSSAVKAVSLRGFREWAATHPRVEVVDANPLLENPWGQPDPNLFWPDGTTLAATGYRRIANLLRDQITD